MGRQKKDKSDSQPSTEKNIQKELEKARKKLEKKNKKLNRERDARENRESHKSRLTAEEKIKVNKEKIDNALMTMHAKKNSSNNTTNQLDGEKKPPLGEKPIYIVCPKCQFNYIVKQDEYCEVCKVDLGLVDKSSLMLDEEEDEADKVCPICKINYIGEDEEICIVCQKEKQDRAIPQEDEDNWQDDEIEDEPLPPADIEISLSEIEDDEIYDDEEDIGKSNVDDFEYVNPDDMQDDSNDDDEDDDNDEF